jgi:uncharacterized phiE125 gp8 family phage protein
MIARNILITGPSYEPVTDQQACDHVREDISNITKVKPYLSAARVSVEQEMISLKTTQGTYELQISDWYDGFDEDGYLTLPACPLVSVTSIKYDDVNNAEQTLASSNYQVDSSSLPGRIRYTGSATLPAVYDKPNCIRIRYVAGHGASSATDGGQSAVPEPVKAAVLLRLGELYEVRTESVGGMMSPVSLSVQRLISAYRIPV